MSAKDKKVSLPFKSNIMMGLGDDIFMTYHSVYKMMFNAMITGMCSLILLLSTLLMFILGDSDILLGFFTASFLIIIISGTIMFIYFLRVKGVIYNIPKSLLPLRFKAKLELIPILNDNYLKELFNRVVEVYNIQLLRHFNFNKILNQKVRGDKLENNFDIYCVINPKTKVWPFIKYGFPAGIFLLFFGVEIWEYIEGNDTFTYESFWSLFVLLIIMAMILLLDILKKKFFPNITKDSIIFVRKLNKVSIKEIKTFKSNVEDVIRKVKKVPLESIILTDKEIKAPVIEYVQTKNGLIGGKYPITFIKLEDSRFKLIWKDSPQ